jgi:hypothetical protein
MTSAATYRAHCVELETIEFAFLIFWETATTGNFSISERIPIKTTPSADAENKNKINCSEYQVTAMTP